MAGIESGRSEKQEGRSGWSPGVEREEDEGKVGDPRHSLAGESVGSMIQATLTSGMWSCERGKSEE